MSRGVAIAFLHGHSDLRCFGDLWVPWPESGIANKAQAPMMRVLGEPVTVETLHRALETLDTGTASSLSTALSSDHRFIRTIRYT